MFCVVKRLELAPFEHDFSCSSFFLLLIIKIWRVSFLPLRNLWDGRLEITETLNQWNDLRKIIYLKKFESFTFQKQDDG